jgi:hypothetical protein
MKRVRGVPFGVFLFFVIIDTTPIISASIIPKEHIRVRVKG